MSTGIAAGIADRNTILGTLVNGDRYASAALQRGDDIALLRRLTKLGATDAIPLAVERAWMRGNSRVRIARALGTTSNDLSPMIAGIYQRIENG